MADQRQILTPLLFASIFVMSACATAPVAKVKTDYGEQQARDAEQALDDAENQMDALEVEAADEAMARARASLQDPDIEYYPERGVLRARLGKAEARLVRTHATKERLSREIVMNRQQERVAEAMDKLDETLLPLEGLQITKEDIVRAKEAFFKTRQALARGKAFESQFSTYAKYATDCEASMSKKQSQIALAEGVVAFVNGPAVRGEKAKELLNDASAATSTIRPNLYRQALANLESCRLSGKEMLASVSDLNSAKVWVGGETTTPKAIIDFCDKRVESLRDRIAEATKEAQKAQARRVPPAPASTPPAAAPRIRKH